MRLRCYLFGCEPHDNPACQRCNAYLYDSWFVHGGWIEPLFAAGRRLRRFVVGKRCSECGKRMPRGTKDYCCSEKCYETWIPF